jgi:hypothetical protein
MLLNLDAGAYTLTFRSGDAAGFDIFIDNVTLKPSVVTPITAEVWLFG